MKRKFRKMNLKILNLRLKRKRTIENSGVSNED